MSLINDALKKAQRERSGETPPATPPPPPPAKVTPPPATPVARSADSTGSGGFKAWPWMIAVLVVVVGFVAWRGMGPSKESSPVTVASETRPAEIPAVVAPAKPPAKPTPDPEVTTPVERTPEPVPTAVVESQPPDRKGADSRPAVATVSPPVQTAPAAVVVATKPEPITAPEVIAPKPEPVAPPVQSPPVKVEPPRIEPEQQAIVVNIPSATNEKPTAAPTLPAMVITIPESNPGSSPAAPLVSVRQQDPRILAYLDALRVNGIRPSPDDPKVLMNNRVFRIGDVVDRELNLRLTVIAPNKLTFEDERGMPYLKSF